MSTPLNVDIRIANPRDEEARKLILESDRLMASLYPAESNHLESAEELAKANVVFIGAYLDQTLVGCGAVKMLHDDVLYGEIKRVFVIKAHRGKGVFGRIMAYLESYLIEHEASVSRLETGTKQAEALHLYWKLGYLERGPFGDYREDPWSVFMEKHLQPPEDRPIRASK